MLQSAAGEDTAHLEQRFGWAHTSAAKTDSFKGSFTFRSFTRQPTNMGENSWKILSYALFCPELHLPDSNTSRLTLIPFLSYTFGEQPKKRVIHSTQAIIIVAAQASICLLSKKTSN